MVAGGLSFFHPPLKDLHTDDSFGEYKGAKSFLSERVEIISEAGMAVGVRLLKNGRVCPLCEDDHLIWPGSVPHEDAHSLS